MAAVRLRETIVQCLQEAQSDSDELKQQSLQTLASITKELDSTNRRHNFYPPHTFSVLLAILQTLSFSILFNLSLNPNLKQTLADMETIYHLNAMILTSTSPETSKLAASLICSLAMLDKNKAKFGVAGTIQSLVKAVSGPRGPAAHHLLSSLAELVQFHENCTVVVRSGAIQVLIGVVQSTDGEDLAGTSLGILGLLARFDEGLKTLIKIDHIVSSMLEVLKGRCMLSKE
ncbi:hypothetical protein RJ639_024878, partial [Escallonia herrerae]